MDHNSFFAVDYEWNDWTKNKFCNLPGISLIWLLKWSPSAEKDNAVLIWCHAKSFVVADLPISATAALVVSSLSSLLVWLAAVFEKVAGI